jgi:beta-N-acetylhexosaminidase
MNPHAPVMLDIAGTTLTKADVQRLRHPLTGGLILFARNFENRRQLTELTAAAKKVRPDLLICVDHEGGRVQRFRTDGFTHLPAMRVLGEMWMKDGADRHRCRHGRGHVLAAELRACGVDLSFTPVLDLDFGASSVIGDRAFHRDPRVVTPAGQEPDARPAARRHGQLRQALSRPRLRQGRQPHRRAGGQAQPEGHPGRRCQALRVAQHHAHRVMPAHVVYPKVDHRPAGFSRPLAEGHPARPDRLHRRHLQRRPQHGRRPPPRRPSLSYTEAACLALEAGCDMVLLCNQSVDGGAAVDELLAGLAEAVAQGHWHPDPDSEVRRSALLPQTVPLAWDDLMHDPVYQRALERLP